MTNSNIMGPSHPLWNEFCERLEGAEGCNFHKDESGKIKWRCKGGRDKSLATAILETMPNVDVLASLEFFEGHSGHCDCEILFNVT